MHKSKLIRLLSVLRPEEIYQLSLFTNSSLFNDGKRPIKVQALLKYLLKFHPAFKQNEIEKSKVFEKVFPNENFNKNKLDKLSSELVSLICKYISTCYPDKLSEYNYWLKQIHFFQERQLDTEFQHAVKQLQKLHEKTAFKDESYFYSQFKLETERTLYSVRTNKKKSDIHLTEAISALDKFYIISKMEFCSYLLSTQNSIQLESNDSMLLLEEVLEIAKNNHLDIPIINAYFHIYPLLLRNQSKGNVNYPALKSVLNRYSGQISKSTLRTLHNYMRNYLADQYNHGDNLSLFELFELFKEQTKQGTIYQDDFHIHASTLQSAITVAVKLGEYQWAFDFLTDHEKRINGADQAEALFGFNLANIYFHQGHYDKAQEVLNKYHFRDTFYNLAVRRLELKLNFETKMPLDFFDSRLKAFKSFIQEYKKQLSPDKFEANNNFIKLMLQIFNLLRRDEQRQFIYNADNKKDIIRVDKILGRLKDEKIIAEREWLFEKLHNLKN